MKTTSAPQTSQEEAESVQDVPEEEDVEDGQVEGQTQGELSHHHPGEDMVCVWV